MGVTGLWEIVQPCARPIKIDTLNKKRLAIDASIWVYHFLKAVRDKEGNALRNSHVVGFYRRICKLLFFGIKPVFVFDGGAPALKRQTITGRKARREGRREDATRTAGKLLALQMQRAAEAEEERQRRAAERPDERDDNEEAVPENPVYVDELQMTQQERQQQRKFRRKDQYHLPDLSVSLSEMGGPNDPRVMSLEELQHYAKQFEAGEDINVYDFSKIDFESPFFTSLPASDRYNILNAARLRSRLRMGYSKDQLETMFPDRMEFSRFQIERVRERNELTQRLMQVGTPEDGLFAAAGGRVAGERGREYVLVKNPDVEGGWALGVIGDNEKDEGQRDKPIDIEEKARQAARVKAEEEQDLAATASENEKEMSQEVQKRREEFYAARRREMKPHENRKEARASAKDDGNSLFVAETDEIEAQASSEDEDSEDEEAQLQIALAMSLEGIDDEPAPETRKPKLPKQQRAPRSAPFANSKGSFANLANARARRAAPEPAEPSASRDEHSSEEDTMDLQGALAESRQSKYKSRSPTPVYKPAQSQTGNDSRSTQPATEGQQKFDGPLPFEKLDLGSSLLGRKKMKQIEEDTAGGFVKDTGRHDDDETAKSPPPWFAGDVAQGMEAQREIAAKERQQARQAADDEEMFRPPPPRLREENEVIDLEATKDGTKEPVVIDSSEGENDDRDDDHLQNVEVVDPEIRFGDMADRVRAEPPVETQTSHIPSPKSWSKLESAIEQMDQTKERKPNGDATHSDVYRVMPGTRPSPAPKRKIAAFMDEDERSDEEIEWDASDREDSPPNKRQKPLSPKPRSPVRGSGAQPTPEARSASPDDIYMPDQNVLEQWAASANEANSKEETSPTDTTRHHQSPKYAKGPQNQANIHRSPTPEDLYIPTDADVLAMVAQDESASSSPGLIPASGTAPQASEPHPANFDDDLPFSDNESDDELMASLAAEAEEHARFTSNFNSKPMQQNIADYEAELKALRSQHKKDRRDADEVTTIMIQECQQLLKLFGLPYITAPMEAEAQCAELVTLGLVDGIVTDDSDCFLFGGTRIYKNMFNQAKFVECYLASDLERDFDLTRRKMIAVAHLLGSDYTEGLTGVGPVTALEILTEFPAELIEFKDWFTGLQQGNPLSDKDQGSAFRKKFKKQTTKLVLPPSFPDQRVDAAYLKPEVDSDPSTFQWGIPDLDALRSFLMATIGWSADRTDEVLVPVIRDMNRRENEGTQANITAFLGGNTSVGAGAFAPRVRAEGRSRRMEAALEKMADRARRNKTSNGAEAANGEEAIINRSGSAVDGSAGVSVSTKKTNGTPFKKTQKGMNQANEDGMNVDNDEDAESDFEARKPKRRGKKQTRKKRAA